MNAALHLWRNLDFTWKHSISNGSWMQNLKLGTYWQQNMESFRSWHAEVILLCTIKKIKIPSRQKKDDLNCFECHQLSWLFFFIALNIGSHHAYPVWYDILIN